MDLRRDRLAQFAIAGRVGVEGVPVERRAVRRLRDKGGRRQVRFTVAELDRSGHRLGQRRNLDERRFRYGGELAANVWLRGHRLTLSAMRRRKYAVRRVPVATC